ncbi:SpoIIE family protein phosphatase [Ureibacillus aquaedulcis]|uniref:SpoIIE family protein phosphatase n=1 Tax=Ureibacillus aquaedulcis TaxID=3058421 RepID=A0ABT8GTX0_9BACL|nr:SpoIIE family protein phosphatase [Ureibacillus sp. BA0131]MDN4494859.1 SpoIIE family protein phosphatase [Ureibacillus sp. BA0131]
MDELIEEAPCGFLTLSRDGMIQSINRTLLKILQCPSPKQLIGKHINAALANSAQIFMQLYFFPLIKTKHRVEEMYISLHTESGEEIPVLLNASLQKNNEIVCVIVPMHNRNAFEDEILHAKKMAENAYRDKEKTLMELESALKSVEEKQQELLIANNQNAKYKLDTERELELAKKIQETALTKDIINDKIQIVSYYHASKALSGDIYGFYQVTPEKYGIILLDVMGHGISSALITMSLQSLFQKLISQGVRAENVMQELDQYLHELFQNNQDAWHYCTAIYFNIDTTTRTVEYINAGHPPAIIQNIDGEQQELLATSPPLGTFEDITFKSRTINYTQGTRLLLYTDGVSEAFEPNTLNYLLHDSLPSDISETKGIIQGALENTENKFEKYNHDDQCFILIEL